MNDPRAYFPFYPADFWGSERVSLMSMEAVGLYLMMLSREWQSGSASADPVYWKRFAGDRIQDFDSTWGEVLPCFEERDGRLYNKRLEEERGIADQFSSQQSDKAKARWDRWRAKKDAAAQPRKSRSKATAIPLQDRTGSDQTGSDRTTEKPRAARTGPHAELIQHFEARWLDTRGVPYAVQPKDGAAAAKALKLAGGDLGLAKDRVETMLTSSDSWVAQHASLPLLVSQWNQFAVTVVPRSKSALQNTLDGLAAMGMDVSTAPSLKAVGQ